LRHRTDIEVKVAAVDGKTSLVLVRTPFQAWLVERVIKAEGVTSFDLLYFTQSDSSEDRFYYERLAKRARAARFIHVPRQARDFFNHVRFALASWPFMFGKRYDATFVSSIDSFVLNAMALRKSAGELVTFDDGTANYNQAGVYFHDNASLRSGLYRYLFRSKPLSETREKIERHYTIHPNLENIVDEGRLHAIPGWTADSIAKEKSKILRSYFIGGPFNEVLDSRKINLLESHVKNVGVDMYVRHPREIQPLNLGVSFLEKQGKIAEEAILEDAGGRSIVLVGFLSSVMFNLASCAERRIIFVPRGSQRHASLVELARKSGCEIILLDETHER
tara:strand:+ start:12475 stop:13476 length:1002 start_codon:yes stop_codon:yes gene_type:complete